MIPPPMAKQSKIPRGPEGFECYYSSIFQTRWPTLSRALQAGHSYIGLTPINPAAEIYYLDTASVLPALLLEITPGQKVLDLCAAPGGKSLVLLRQLFPWFFSQDDFNAFTTLLPSSHYDSPPIITIGEFVANERSAKRRARLRQNIQNHTNQPFQNAIKITSHDATKWGLYEQNQYDRILLDAPCSSERHLIENPKHLDDWSSNRSKQLAIQAGAMALAGLEALRPGGLMVYSTCALSPQENDQVIAKVLKKRENAQIHKPANLPEWVEQTEYGHQILPDTSGGLGPIYFSRLTKIEEQHPYA